MKVSHASVRAGTVGGPPVKARRSADSAARSSGNTGTTLTNDDTLLFAMGANEVWFFQAWLYVNAANTTMNSKFGLSVPASATATWGGNGVGNVAQPGFGAWTSTTPIAMLTESGVLTVLTFAGTMGVGIAGTVTNSATPGNCVIQWAQSVSNASNLVMKINSRLAAERDA